MNPNPERIGALFEAARHLASQAERAAYLDRACGEDLELRRHIEAMLEAEAAADQYFRTADVPGEAVREVALRETPTASAEPLTEGPGTIIGRYKLLQQIGEGGFGVVYMAEQREPVVRKVALKVIKLGMDTKQVVARFEAERQALALMDHPHIAKVLDGGATETGRPYFVMELVHGIPITAYCDRNNLSPAERLELLLPVCHAIQHAHQKGIIHRDIKPSNVLVTLNDGVPHPMVIDFGVAKALNQRLTEKTLFTDFGQMIGTPAYMSPEQAEMSKLDVDTRSDVYALGVLLYELLTGTTPFPEQRLRGAGWAEMQRIITEEEPLRPSSRLSALTDAERTGIAQHRQTDARKLTFLVRGELDWIVMKALEKDRTRRYETANGLAMDIQRYLHDEPVLAVAPSAVYRVRKFARRNKVMVTAAALVAAALVLGILGSTWQAVRATRAESKAGKAFQSEAAQRQQAEKAQANEAQLRKQAQAQAYAADMSLAHQALSQNNLGRALSLLDRHRPKAGERDLRGWEWRYLWKQCRSDEASILFQKSGITDIIESLAISSDGKWLAAARDAGLAIWDLTARQQFLQLPGSHRWPRVAFSPREPLLAFAVTTNAGSAQSQSSIQLWDGQTRGIVAELPLSRECAGLAFSEDGQTLVTASVGDPGEITLWNVPERRRLATHRVRLSYWTPAGSLGVSRDLRLAACLFWRRLSVVDLVTGQVRWTRETDGNLLACAFSPDGKTLATSSGYAETVIRLWDIASGRELGVLEGHRSCVYNLLFWPDGQKLASASADQTIRVWELTSRQSITTLRGHRDEVHCLALLPDNTTLVSGSKDGSVRLWDTVHTGRSRSYTRLPTRLWTWCFSADSRSIFTVDQQGKVARWHGADFQEMQPLFEVYRAYQSSPIRSSHFSQDGRLLASASTNGVLQVWDLSRRTVLYEMQVNTGPALPVQFLNQATTIVILHPDDGSLHEWNLARGQETRSWLGVAQPLAVAFSPDERWCLMFGFQGASRRRDMMTGRETNPNLHIGTTESAAFSPDGRLFAAASYSSFVRLWDTASGREVATLDRFLLGAHSVAFSPDGTRLAASSTGQETLKLWSVESHHEVLTLESQESRFVFSAFSPDGNMLGSRSMEGFLHLWHAPSWEEIAAAEAEEKAEIKLP